MTNYSVMLLGDNCTGKTCISDRFCCKRYNYLTYATIGIDFRKNIECNLDGESIKLDIWDTAGNERFQALIRQFLSHSKIMGFLVVYDITEKSTFNELSVYFTMIDKHASPDVPKVLVGHKCDDTERRVVTEEQGRKLAEEMGIPFFECSSKENVNICESFMTVARMIREQKEGRVYHHKPLRECQSEPIILEVPLPEDHGVVTDINFLWKEGKGTDVKFVIETLDGEIEVFAHQLILAVRSSSFADMFYTEEKVKQYQIIPLKKVNPKAFAEMIRYCYDDDPKLKTTESACDLFKVATEFRVISLVNLCSTFIRQSKIEPGNVLSILEFSEQVGDKSTGDMCFKVLQEKTREIMASYKLSNVTPSMVHVILNLPKLSLNSEYELVNWVFAWAKLKCGDDLICKNTRVYLEKFLNKMYFLSLSADEFAMLCKDNPFFFSSDEMTRISLNIASASLKTVLPGTREMPNWYNKNYNMRVYTGLKK